MTSTAHIELAQHLATDVLVELFILDCTALNAGQGVYTFTPGTLNGAKVVYQGVTYTPIPIHASGFDITSQGSQPRPKMTISNINGYAGGLVIAGGDMLGAKLTRLRTFQRFLDGQPGADPDAHWPAQVFMLDRKSAHNKDSIEFELATPLENKMLKIPGCLAMKNSCQQRYRTWNATSATFDYTRATCTYTGATYFSAQGTSVPTAAQDQCGKRLSDCRSRFGFYATLPFLGFPGMVRL